jgi:hypothetical protein
MDMHKIMKIGNGVNTENSLKKAQHSQRVCYTGETRMFRPHLNQHCSIAVALCDSFAKDNISSKLRLFSFGFPALLSD